MNLKNHYLCFFFIFASTRFFAMAPGLTNAQRMDEIKKTPKITLLKYLSSGWIVGKLHGYYDNPNPDFASMAGDNGAASGIHAQLGKEAQDIVDIHEYERLQIRKAKQDYAEEVNLPFAKNKKEPVVTGIYGICVDEKTFNDCSYGTNRVAMMRAAISRKKAHHEQWLASAGANIPVYWAFFAGAFAGTALIFSQLPKLRQWIDTKLKRIGGYPQVLFYTAGVISLITSLIWADHRRSKLDKKQTREADILGAYASQCHNCVRCYAEHRGNLGQNKEGYMEKKDFDSIADQLEKEKLLCSRCKTHIDSIPQTEGKIPGKAYHFPLGI